MACSDKKHFLKNNHTILSYCQLLLWVPILGANSSVCGLIWPMPMKPKILAVSLLETEFNNVWYRKLASSDLTECENIYSTNISKNFKSFGHGRQANIFLINPIVKLRLAKASKPLTYSFWRKPLNISTILFRVASEGFFSNSAHIWDITLP